MKKINFSTPEYYTEAANEKAAKYIANHKLDISTPDQYYSPEANVRASQFISNKKLLQVNAAHIDLNDWPIDLTEFIGNKKLLEESERFIKKYKIKNTSTDILSEELLKDIYVPLEQNEFDEIEQNEAKAYLEKITKNLEKFNLQIFNYSKYIGLYNRIETNLTIIPSEDRKNFYSSMLEVALFKFDEEAIGPPVPLSFMEEEANKQTEKAGGVNELLQARTSSYITNIKIPKIFVMDAKLKGTAGRLKFISDFGKSSSSPPGMPMYGMEEKIKYTSGGHLRQWRDVSVKLTDIGAKEKGWQHFEYSNSEIKKVVDKIPHETGILHWDKAVKAVDDLFKMLQNFEEDAQVSATKSLTEAKKIMDKLMKQDDWTSRASLKSKLGKTDDLKSLLKSYGNLFFGKGNKDKDKEKMEKHKDQNFIPSFNSYIRHEDINNNIDENALDIEEEEKEVAEEDKGWVLPPSGSYLTENSAKEWVTGKRGTFWNILTSGETQEALSGYNSLNQGMFGLYNVPLKDPINFSETRYILLPFSNLTMELAEYENLELEVLKVKKKMKIKEDDIETSSIPEDEEDANEEDKIKLPKADLYPYKNLWLGTLAEEDVETVTIKVEGGLPYLGKYSSKLGWAVTVATLLSPSIRNMQEAGSADNDELTNYVRNMFVASSEMKTGTSLNGDVTFLLNSNFQNQKTNWKDVYARVTALGKRNTQDVGWLKEIDNITYGEKLVNDKKSNQKRPCEWLIACGADWLTNIFDALFIYRDKDTFRMPSKYINTKDTWFDSQCFLTRSVELSLNLPQTDTITIPFLQSSIDKQVSKTTFNTSAIISFRLDQNLFSLEAIERYAGRNTLIGKQIKSLEDVKKNISSDGTFFTYEGLLKDREKIITKTNNKKRLDLVLSLDCLRPVEIEYLENNPLKNKLNNKRLVLEDVRFLGNSQNLTFGVSTADVAKASFEIIFLRMYLSDIK